MLRWEGTKNRNKNPFYVSFAAGPGIPTSAEREGSALYSPEKLAYKSSLSDESVFGVEVLGEVIEVAYRNKHYGLLTDRATWPFRLARKWKKTEENFKEQLIVHNCSDEAQRRRMEENTRIVRNSQASNAAIPSDSSFAPSSSLLLYPPPSPPPENPAPSTTSIPTSDVIPFQEINHVNSDARMKRCRQIVSVHAKAQYDGKLESGLQVQQSELWVPNDLGNRGRLEQPGLFTTVSRDKDYVFPFQWGGDVVTFNTKVNGEDIASFLESNPKHYGLTMKLKQGTYLLTANKYLSEPDSPGCMFAAANTAHNSYTKEGRAAKANARIVFSGSTRGQVLQHPKIKLTCSIKAGDELLVHSYGFRIICGPQTTSCCYCQGSQETTQRGAILVCEHLDEDGNYDCDCQAHVICCRGNYELPRSWFCSQHDDGGDISSKEVASQELTFSPRSSSRIQDQEVSSAAKCIAPVPWLYGYYPCPRYLSSNPSATLDTVLYNPVLGGQLQYETRYYHVLPDGLCTLRSLLIASGAPHECEDVYELAYLLRDFFHLNKDNPIKSSDEFGVELLMAHIHSFVSDDEEFHQMLNFTKWSSYYRVMGPAVYSDVNVCGLLMAALIGVKVTICNVNEENGTVVLGHSWAPADECTYVMPPAYNSSVHPDSKVKRRAELMSALTNCKHVIRLRFYPKRKHTDIVAPGIDPEDKDTYWPSVPIYNTPTSYSIALYKDLISCWKHIKKCNDPPAAKGKRTRKAKRINKPAATTTKNTKKGK